MDLSINEGTLVVTGGIGDSVEYAIAIRKTPKELSAAGAEHILLTQRYGRHGEGWTLRRQDLLNLDGRTYDTVQIVLQDGSKRTLYFDMTDWLDRAQSHFDASR